MTSLHNNDIPISGNYMVEPVSTISTGVEALGLGIKAYNKGKEIFEAINTKYGKLSISITFILKLHNNVPLETNIMDSIIRDLGGRKENHIYRINMKSGFLIINHIDYDTDDDSALTYGDLLELSGATLPEWRIQEKYEDSARIPVPLIESVYLYAFLNTPGLNAVVDTYNFFEELNRKFNEKIPVKKQSLFIRIKSEKDKKIIEKFASDLNKEFNKNNIPATVVPILDSSGFHIKYKITTAIQAQAIDKLLFGGFLEKVKRSLPLCFL